MPSSTIAASFKVSLRSDRLVRVPLLIASGAGDLIEQGLASLLKDRGVPADRVAARAAQAVQRLGLGPIQNAMCSHATPAFQFVLQDELAQVVQARSSADPANKRQKKKPRARDGGNTTPLPIPVAPQVDQVRIPPGVFASEGQPLHQVELQSIAAPYLKLEARHQRYTGRSCCLPGRCPCQSHGRTLSTHRSEPL